MPGPRPSVSTLTNGVSLPTLTAAELVAAANANRLPDSLLPFFLHEYAHHQCFSSAVGNAWASLEAEALGEFRRALERGAWEMPRVARRLHSLNQLMRPLLEGLALFAEHDVYPGSSPVASPLVVWTTMLFRADAALSPDVPLTSSALDQMTQTLLCSNRHQPEWVERKANLLLQPLDLSNGGYLAGYLAVRNFWLLARSRAPRLTDSSLFLSYVSALLFDDYGLVALLLDDELDEEERADEMHERLKLRLALLGRKDLDSHVEEYEQAIATSASDRWWLGGHHDCLFLDEATVSANRSAADRRVRQHLPMTAEGLNSDSFALASIAALTHHGYRRLGMADVTVSVSDGRVVARADDVVVLDEVAEADASGGTQETDGTDGGRLLLYFDADALSTMLICVRGPQVVYVRAPSSPAGDDPKLSAFIINLVLVSEPMLNELLDSVAREMEPEGAAPSPLVAALTETYQRYALVFVDPGYEPACAAAMARDGFWTILNANPDLVRALALLGIMSSCRRRNLHGPPMFEWHGFDFDVSRRQLLEAGARWRYPLVTADLTPPALLQPNDGMFSMV